MSIRPSRLRSYGQLRLPRPHPLPTLAALCGALLFSAPSGSSHQAPEIDALGSSEIALLEELGEWIVEDPKDVRGVIRQRPTSFEVFRSYHEPQLRNSILEEIPFGALITRTAERHGLDPLLVASIVETESSFNPHAISHRGAVGLMQVLPSTAESHPEALLEPSLNLESGARYLRYLLQRYGGDLELALAAYNAGPTNVRRYGGVPPFRETRQYVEKVLNRYFAHHQDVWQTTATGELLAAAHGEGPALGGAAG
ncbi:MAG: lytic transglycosylase domain-containing protein [Acidobacteriota bacterium]